MNSNESNGIWPDEVKGYIDHRRERDYLLVDVRQPGEYEKEHIPGARLLPLKRALSGHADLPKDKDLIFYCQHGIRSNVAAHFCIDNGFDPKKVFSMRGGIAAWEDKVLPGFPRTELFRAGQGFSDVMHTAINLEKGAFLYYSFLIDASSEKHFAAKFAEIAGMEMAHAKLVFGILSNREDPKTSFQDFFSSLSGDIIEGGLPLDQACRKITEMPGEFIINSLEMALDIEYSAYDLYRSITGKTHGKETNEALHLIAQAEKNHIHLIADILETISPSGD